MKKISHGFLCQGDGVGLAPQSSPQDGRELDAKILKRKLMDLLIRSEMTLNDSITSPLLNQVNEEIVLLHDLLTDFIVLQIVYFEQHVGKKASSFKGSCFYVAVEPGSAEGLKSWTSRSLKKRRLNHHTGEERDSLL